VISLTIEDRVGCLGGLLSVTIEVRFFSSGYEGLLSFEIYDIRLLSTQDNSRINGDESLEYSLELLLH
jgi:hypothetical protein